MGHSPAPKDESLGPLRDAEESLERSSVGLQCVARPPSENVCLNGARNGSRWLRGAGPRRKLASNSILTVLVQVRRLACQLLSPSLIDPLESRSIGLPDPGAGYSPLAQGRCQEEISGGLGNGAASRRPRGDGPGLGERPWRPSLRMAAPVLVNLVEIVGPVGIGPKILRRGVGVQWVIPVTAAVEGVPGINP